MPYIINCVDWSMIDYDNKNYHTSLPTRKGLKQRLQRSSIDMCIIRHVTVNGSPWLLIDLPLENLTSVDLHKLRGLTRK